MRRAALVFAVWSSLAVAGSPQVPQALLRDGDLVFQTSRSSQSSAIRLATHSPYSHVGIVEVSGDGIFVIEAIQPVSRTPIASWKARGQGGRWTVLRDRTLTEAQREAVVTAAKAELGKPYDLHFGWDDETVYCSELVRKAYARGAGRAVGALQTLGSLDLRLVKAQLEARYGAGKIPLDLVLITPASVAKDPALSVVTTDFRMPRAVGRSPRARR